MAVSYPDYTATDQWTDLVTIPAYAGIAGQRTMLQNKGIQRTLVYFGGAAAPTGAGFGTRLAAEVSVTGTSDHVWVKGEGPVAIQVED